MGSLSDDIVKYKKGELSPQEMHTLEKKALADPFLAEALEGIEEISPEALQMDVSAVDSKISGNKKTSLFTPLRIAAGVVLLVSSVFLIYQFIPPSETIALQSDKPKAKNENREGEKAGSGNQPKVTSNEKAIDQSGKSKAGSQKLNAESAIQKQDLSKSPVKIDEKTSSKITDAEPKNENAEAEIAAPTTQAPAQDLAAGQDQPVKIENKEDGIVKDITGPEQKGAGAKAISREKKKESFAASEAQRSAVPSSKINRLKSISGQVVSSEDRSPLPGVNVILKGTTIGTVTDSQGDYKISTASDNSSLVFSFVGLQPQEIDASGRDKVDVQMKEDASQLSEVVVTRGVAKDDLTEPVMKWAEPEGGRTAYDKYLDSNVLYPEQALKNKIKGKAGIEFTVGKDGSLSDFRVVKKLGYGCEEEVIRLVKEGPRWNPTTEDDKPIESTVRVKLRFDPAKKGK